MTTESNLHYQGQRITKVGYLGQATGHMGGIGTEVSTGC